MIRECSNCGEEKEHHARGLCYSCYKKLVWKPKIISCARCKRKLPLHARGYCASCYNFLFHSENAKAYHHRRSNNISLNLFKKITKKCFICGFDKIVDIHHLDMNKKNNHESNLVGLCPNHHRMAKNSKYRQEIYNLLEEKGLKVPKISNI